MPALTNQYHQQAQQDQPEPTGQIPNELKSLSKSCDMLTHRVASLAARCSPLRLPPPAQPVELDKPRQVLVPLAEEIQSCERRVSSALNVLDELLSTIQL